MKSENIHQHILNYSDILFFFSFFGYRRSNIHYIITQFSTPCYHTRELLFWQPNIYIKLIRNFLQCFRCRLSSHFSLWLKIMRRNTNYRQSKQWYDILSVLTDQDSFLFVLGEICISPKSSSGRVGLKHASIHLMSHWFNNYYI